jgi:hypothetical protein
LREKYRSCDIYHSFQCKNQGKKKRNGFSHPFCHITGAGSRQQVNIVACNAFEEDSRQPEIRFQVANDRFDSRPSSAALSLFISLITVIRAR